MICWQNGVPVLTYPNLMSFQITQSGVTIAISRTGL